MKSLDLKPLEKRNLEKGQWLTDKHMSAATKLLQRQFPGWGLEGLQSTLLKLYDSHFNNNVTPSLEVQLVQLYHPAIEGGVLLVTAESVQQQTGANDCGLFNIIFAYHAARALDVSRLQVEQQDMREHLHQCFELQNLTSFTPAKKSVQMSQVKHFAINV